MFPSYLDGASVIMYAKIEEYGVVEYVTGEPYDTLCYYDDSNGKHIIFSKINDEDIVVGNIDELKEALLFISNEFQKIKDSSSKIKRYKKEAIK